MYYFKMQLRFMICIFIYFYLFNCQVTRYYYHFQKVIILVLYLCVYI